MKPKSIFTIALVIFLCATAVYFILDEVKSKSGARQAEREQLQEGEAGASSSERHGSTPTLPQEPANLAEGTRTTSDKVGPSNPQRTATLVPAETRPATNPSQPPKKESVSTAVIPSSPKKERTVASGQIVSEQQKQASTPSKQTAVPPGSQSVSPQSVDSKSYDPQTPTAAPPKKVIAYYFHGTQRCPTCRKLEAYSAEAIEKGFGEALKQGQLEWRVVNVDEPLNKHFVNDYQLYTKSLVIVKMQGGKQVEWKNLEKIWELVGERDDFIKYVRDEVSAYLGEGK
jgi:hypothetical protein